MTSKIGPQRMSWLELLRGVAALGVALWHTSDLVGPYGEGPLGRLLQPAATLGVCLFFMISGFVMVYTTTGDAKRSKPVSFLWRRFTKVWPLYAILTMLTVVTVRSSGLTSEHLLASLTFLPYGDATKGPAYSWPVLNVGWTLVYEMYFYVVFAISLAFGRFRWAALAGWFIFALIVVPAALGGLTASPSSHLLPAPRIVNLLTNPISGLFLAGCVIALLYRRGWLVAPPGVAPLALVAAAAVAAAQAAYTWPMTYEASWTIVLPVVLAIAACTQSVRTFSIPAWAAGLGTVSYSLYLTHPIAKGWYLNLAAPVGLPKTGYVAFAIASCMAVAIAFVSYRLVEKPATDGVRRILTRRGVQRDAAQSGSNA